MEQTFTIPYKTLDRSELSEKDRQLEERALEVAQKAYAPYSRFHVGAAVLLANGDVGPLGTSPEECCTLGTSPRGVGGILLVGARDDLAIRE